jgi:integrase
LADTLVEDRLPRHQAEPEPVVDHGVAPAGEIGRTRERAADVLSGLRRLEGATALFRHLLPDPLDLLALQGGDKIPRQEVRLLKAEPNLKMRTAFITIYAAGLRVSEVVALTAKDIDSDRMVIHIRQGKGRRDRYVMLSDQLLSILRDYWRRAHLKHLLFPGPDGSRPVTTRSLQRACRWAAQSAGRDKAVTVHTLRHCFATHLLEQGVDIRVIQDLLGHRQITSSTRYARVAVNTIRQIQSPWSL